MVIRQLILNSPFIIFHFLFRRASYAGISLTENGEFEMES
jgi:hypothetical protein